MLFVIAVILITLIFFLLFERWIAAMIANCNAVIYARETGQCFSGVEHGQLRFETLTSPPNDYDDDDTVPFPLWLTLAMLHCPIMHIKRVFIQF